MEIIEPQNFFISLLLFFSGCFMNQSPEPVTITIPRSIESKFLKLGEGETVLLFELDKNGNLFYNIHHETGSTTTEKINKDDKSIGLAIDKASTMAKNNSNPLKIMIKGNDHLKYEAFKQLIGELKSRGIYKYQMITEPE